MSRWITTCRIAIMAALLWFVYGETGLATTTVLTLIFAADEMRAAIDREDRK